jgi:parallel beta-helix repeat protein
MNHPDTGALVWIYNSSYNTIINNNVSYCHYYGILIEQLSHHNIISNNLAAYNTEIGIHLRNSADLNVIEENVIHLNPTGIAIYSYCDNNTIKGNCISHNTIGGVFVNYLTTYNVLYTNCFINNTLHARDDGNNNVWDFASKGNYWDNYTGTDLNENGIGDIHYNISGTAESIDHFPLMKCPIPSIPSVILGYELYILLSGMLISMISVIYLIYRKKALKF